MFSVFAGFDGEDFSLILNLLSLLSPQIGAHLHLLFDKVAGLSESADKLCSFFCFLLSSFSIIVYSSDFVEMLFHVQLFLLFN